MWSVSVSMAFSRRHLPHWVPDEAAFFVTWRLAGSIPFGADLQSNRAESFLERDEGLDCFDPGPVWLQDCRIAQVIADALLYGESVRQFYDLYAWVIMSNHVHVVFQPRVELPRIMRWLKGRTARQANRILGLAGNPFWKDESFDHWIRTKEELRDFIAYVENNPVKAGLVAEACQWPWSSAGDGRRRKTIVCPTFASSCQH